ncbi:MAG TPA: DNA repair protein RadA [Ilumatobacteraceae bacterium]|nr:DNA repair protein RadA [Ilumatobacteraceae bacterium]
MSKLRLVYRCSACATAYPKWAGRCPSCEAWNSMVEDVEGGEPDIAAIMAATSGAIAMPISEIDALIGGPQSTGVEELDRVLGGGLVPGSVTLLGGEPGIGKSTLLLQLAATWPTRTLYVSGEESAQQVRLRAERLGAIGPHLWLLAETSLPHIVASLDTAQPHLVIIDSIQSVADPDLGSAPGSVVQVRGCTHRLVAEAKRRGIPMLLVGHVTKDGALAGPRVLEHIVDTVLSFEGDRHHALRLLRAVKHRFGSTNELGVFEMIERGLVGVPDASSLFLTDRRTGVAGSAVTPTLEGHRPLLVEVQALTNRINSGVPPRRSAQGLDPGRLALLLAVLDRRARLPMGQHEVFASAVGGVRLTEPGSDLPMCLAIVSALADQPLPPDVISFGEVGLAGELRQVAHASRRLAEAARLGFTRAIVPANSANGVEGISLVRAATLNEALLAVGLHGVRSK